MNKRLLSILLIGTLAISTIACGDTSSASSSVEVSTLSEEEADPTQESALDYQFGLNETFHSDKPVTYSMFFSDANWYPMVDTWKSEGIFAKITELTNVTLDVISVDSAAYTEKTNIQINNGESPFIIPKVYDETPCINGGAVVAVSDWVQYMPNYLEFYSKYNMKQDVASIIRSDGNYYRLPGMKEATLQDYTLMIRKDIFDAAGYDVATLEKDWTWDTLYDVLVGVKDYMVRQKMCKPSDYIWSDLWCGEESGQGNGGNLLKLIGKSYGVLSGWAISDGMGFNEETKEWYFTPATEDYKTFVTVVNKLIAGGILDPKTFSQEDEVACQKFYQGKTVIISVNRSQYTSWISGLEDGLGAGNFETYMTVYPRGTNNYTSENSRLECGVMIATKALDKLGEQDFIKMMRFVDWLWYSDEAYDLTKWGVKGETYTEVDGQKELLSPYFCGGLGIAQSEGRDVDMRLKYGYAGGNFYYGGTVDQQTDNLPAVLRDYYKRVSDYRQIRAMNPVYSPTERENEQINQWKEPLIDTVNHWTLDFILGKKDIETEFPNYLAELESLNYKDMELLFNEMYKRK